MTQWKYFLKLSYENINIGFARIKVFLFSTSTQANVTPFYRTGFLSPGDESMLTLTF